MKPARLTADELSVLGKDLRVVADEEHCGMRRAAKSLLRGIGGTARLREYVHLLLVQRSVRA